MVTNFIFVFKAGPTEEFWGSVRFVLPRPHDRPHPHRKTGELTLEFPEKEIQSLDQSIPVEFVLILNPRMFVAFSNDSGRLFRTVGER